MDHDFREVKQGLELASRVNELQAYIHVQKQAMTYHETALYVCETQNAKRYVALDTLGTLLYRLSSNLDTHIRPAELLDKIIDLV